MLQSSPSDGIDESINDDREEGSTYTCRYWYDILLFINTVILELIILKKKPICVAMVRYSYHDRPLLAFISLQQRRSTYYMLQSSPSDGIDESINDDINNGLYLNEETYLTAEDNLLRSDGSLDFNNSNGDQQQRTSSSPYSQPVQKIKNKTYQSAVQGLFSPPPSYSYDDEESNNLSKTQQQLSDEEQLYQAVTDQQQNKNQMIDPETLHQRVFAEEQTYLQQSTDFRKSLSSLYDDNVESPIAKERREVINQYNEEVLSNLLKEIDIMEDMALSREEAMSLAKDKEVTKTTGKKKKDGVLCYKCGCRVTPDMIQRAEAIEISKEGGELQQSSGGVLCQACYGQQFRTNNESKVRVATGNFYDSNNKSGGSRMFDKRKKNARQWTKDDSNGDRGRRKWSGREDDSSSDGNVKGDVQGINTSSLFDMPKKKRFDGTERTLSRPPTPTPQSKAKEVSHKSPPNTSSSSTRQKRRQTRPPPRRSSHTSLGGGEELERRMRQQDAEASSESSDLENSQLAREEGKVDRTPATTAQTSNISDQ